MNRQVAIMLSGLAVAAAIPTSSQAQGGGLNPTLNERFSFRLGAAFLDGDTSFSSTSNQTGLAGEVDLGDLGIDGKTTTPYFGFRWRFAERWRLNLEYFGSDQDGAGVAQTDLVFQDIRIPAGVLAEAEFSTDIYAASVGWSFLRDERMELGVGLGLHVADLSARIRGAGFIGDIAVPVAAERADVTAPLPNLRLHGAYAFTPTLAFEAGLGWFSLSYDKYDGKFFVGTAAIEWRPHENFGLGAGYTWLDVDLDVDEARFTDNYDFDLNGPVVFAVAGF
jgi:hypothetical protein